MRDFILEMIDSASQMALQYREVLADLRVGHKSTKDFVTEADQAIERLLRDKVMKHFPDHVFFGEEYGEHGTGHHRWIVDPIDGTSSFVFGQPFFSISIAYEVDGVVEWGAVHAPVLKETFIAQRGHGVTLNDKPIKVSDRNEMNQAIMGTGFACLRSDLEKNNIPYIVEILPNICDIRRLGSAALDLAFVAAGRLDGFWELNLNIYDIAAGKLLIEEAGGKVSDFQGTTLKDCAQIFASNGLLHEPMLALFAKV